MSLTKWSNDLHKLEHTLSPDIVDLINEKNDTCVSIIVPTHRTGAERQVDRVEIQKAVAEVKQLPAVQRADLLKRLDDLLLQVDYNHNLEGIGLFVSHYSKKLARFPFPVTRNIRIAPVFDLRDLLYSENYSLPYYLLSLSAKEIKLFRGLMDHLDEITDHDFPRTILEEYVYNRSAPSSSAAGYAHVKGFEKDKSILSELHLRNTFRDTDRLLTKYLTRKGVPLFLCGAEKDLAIYKSVTDHADNIIASISGNYLATMIHDLEPLAWLQIKSYVDQEKSNLLRSLEEKTGEGSAALGTKDILRKLDVTERPTLLVERHHGQDPHGGNDQLTSERSGDNTSAKEDVINEIVTTVLRRSGNVIVVEKDALKDHEGIALMFH